MKSQRVGHDWATFILHYILGTWLNVLYICLISHLILKWGRLSFISTFQIRSLKLKEINLTNTTHTSRFRKSNCSAYMLDHSTTCIVCLLTNTVRCVLVLVSQLFLTVCNPMDCSRQAPLSMGFPRQEYWSGLPVPSPGDLPDPGIKAASLTSPALADGLFTTSAILL